MLDHLRAQNLIDISKNGASITVEGEKVLQALESAMEDWSGRAFIAKRLEELLGIRSVKVVAGIAIQVLPQRVLLGLEAAKQFTTKLGMARQSRLQVGVQLLQFPNI